MRNTTQSFLSYLQRGATLVEAVVAVGLLGVVITGAAIAVTSSLANAQYSRNQQQATTLAREGMEIVRYIRNADYPTFSGYQGQFCLSKNSDALELCPQDQSANLDDFYRTVEVSPGACQNNLTRVTVRVAWTSPKCDATQNKYCHFSDNVSCLSDISSFP